MEGEGGGGKNASNFVYLRDLHKAPNKERLKWFYSFVQLYKLPYKSGQHIHMKVRVITDYEIIVAERNFLMVYLLRNSEMLLWYRVKNLYEVLTLSSVSGGTGIRVVFLR